jgi:hypothetical protein
VNGNNDKAEGMKLFWKNFAIAVFISLVLFIIMVESDNDLANDSSLSIIMFAWLSLFQIFLLPIIIGFAITFLLKKIKQ